MITIDYKDKIILREQKEEEEKREIVNYLKNHNNVKRDELVYNLKIPLGTLKRDLIKLIEKKIIQKIGSDKIGCYILVEVQNKKAF